MKWQDIANAPLKQDNILYVIHFYAAGHNFDKAVDAAAAKLPLFVTEWASATWERDSENDPEATARWLKVINRHKIGWTYWNFAPGDSVFNTFKTGTSPTKENLDPKGSNVSKTGKLVFDLLQQ
jgi:endoglucanase